MSDVEQTQPKWRLPVLVLVTLVAAAGVLLRPAEVPQAERESFEPQALFGADPPCRPAPGESADHRAETAERDALARVQRYPFERLEGVAAARLYAEASDCHRRAGDAAGAERAGERLQAVRARVWQDVLAQRLRLERALENRQLDEALTEVQALRTLWRERDSEFGKWLWKQEVELQGAVARQAAKGERR